MDTNKIEILSKEISEDGFEFITFRVSPSVIDKKIKSPLVKFSIREQKEG